MPVAHLPRIEVRGEDRPVVHVLDETRGELVYARRLPTNRFQLGVFRPGRYSVLVGDPERDEWRLVPGLDTETAETETSETILVEL